MAVVAAGPRGVVNIGSDPGITVVFNRSMRPVQSSPTAQLPAIAVITQEGKPVEGQWRWVGTHGLLFQPARSLPGATRFHVTVLHGTQALDASRLGADYTLEFATDTARVSRTFPDDSSRRLMPHDALFLKFTQPVDPGELQKHLRLVVRSPGERLGRELPVAIRSSAPQGAARANLDDTEPGGVYEQTQAVTDDSGLWLQVIPTQPLPLDSELELTVSKGLHSRQGTLPTEEPFKWSPRTYGPLHLDDVKCARQNLGRCQAHRDFTVVLSNPVAPDEFRRFLKIEGPTRQSKPIKAAKPKPLRATTEHALALDPEYGDRFKITLRAGMADLYGQKLTKNVSVSLAV